VGSTPEQPASGNGRAVLAVVVGLLSTATMPNTTPTGIAHPAWSRSYDSE